MKLFGSNKIGNLTFWLPLVNHWQARKEWLCSAVCRTWAFLGGL